MRSIIRFAAAALSLAGIVSLAHAEKLNKAFDQWEVGCADPKDGKRACALVTGLVNQKKAVVFQWVISPDHEKKGNKMTITTLTGILVGNGVAVRFGDSEPVRIPYKICMPKFCEAEIPLSDSWLKTFKASKGFSATITAANGKEIKYDVSLSKFSDAFDFYTTEVAKTN